MTSTWTSTGGDQVIVDRLDQRYPDEEPEDWLAETLDAEDDEVDLLLRRGVLRANIGNSVFVVSRLVFSVENGSVDLYVWKEIDNIFEKVHHSLEINELTDMDEILSFLDQKLLR